MSYKIAERLIGDEEPCFIIAEAGVNHNGDINIAKRLIDAAKYAGADAVKFQTFKTEAFITRYAEKANYQKETTNSTESQFDMIKKLELSGDDFKELFYYAQNKGILFLSSPFDKDSVDLLNELGISAFKIGSGEITNFPLLKHIAKKKHPIILSTGMSTLGEVAEALEFLNKEGASDIIILHCVSAYPAKVGDMNLKVIETLRHAFKLPVGLSDHTMGITVPIAAVALGACVIEKHFTLDKKLHGPDHRASLVPKELKDMIKAIRDVEKAMGNGSKCLSATEGKNRSVIRRSIIAKVDIPANTIIRKDMLEIKRPGDGLEPKLISSIIGKKAKVIIKQEKMITIDMIMD